MYRTNEFVVVGVVLYIELVYKLCLSIFQGLLEQTNHQEIIASIFRVSWRHLVENRIMIETVAVLSNINVHHSDPAILLRHVRDLR